MTLEATVIELEWEFWQADPRFHDTHYADDIVTIVDGRIIDRAEAVASIGPVPPGGPRHLRHPRPATHRRDRGRGVPGNGETPGREAPYTALVGSVYVHREGRWQLAFHQHTPP